jgi:hypothetical protein
MLHHFLRSLLFLLVLTPAFATFAQMLRLENDVIVTRDIAQRNQDAAQRKFHVLKMRRRVFDRRIENA